MAKENYKQLACSDVGMNCGFQVRAKTDEEVMKLAKTHAAEAHGVKEISSNTEKKIKENIKPVSVDVPEGAPPENIHTTRQDFKFKWCLLAHCEVYNCGAAGTGQFLSF